MASSRHGEQQRGSPTRSQARQVPAAPARVLRAVAQVRVLRQMVRLHRQGQLAQRMAYALWGQYIPGKGKLYISIYF